MKFIVYKCCDEIIITTEKHEKKMIKDYFKKVGRDKDDYDREEIKGTALQIEAKLAIW